MAVESAANLEAVTPSQPETSQPEPPQPETAAGERTPHNIEAEQALLGAILLNNNALDRVSDFLEERHFFEPLHGRIYATAKHMIQDGKLATPVILRSFFSDDAVLKEMGGADYLSNLTEAAVTIINAEQYGRLIYDLALRRMLMQASEEIHALAQEAPVDISPMEQVERAESALYAITDRERYAQGFGSFASVMAQAVEMAASAQGRDSGLSGLSTGISSLDKKLGGLQPSDLIILAGRPSMGKSALATNIAFHVARTGMDSLGEDGGAVGFFSLEMSSEQVATRILSERAGIASENIRRGAISEAELGHFTQVSAELEKLPLYIDHTGAIPVATLAARARRLKRESDLKLIVVDYLQLATADKRRSSDGRVQEIAEITQSLKALAKQLNIPVLALSQLSRQVESRDDKRPQLSDLRESGAIEQDADVVLFIYREEYYLEQAQPDEGTPEHSKWREKMERAHGLAELLVSKQRHGSTGIIRLQFQADVTRFSDLASSSHIPEVTRV